MNPNYQQKLEEIANLREQKGKETETLAAIEEAMKVVSDEDWEFLIRLYWEEAFVYQHLIMSNIEVDVNIVKMEEVANKADDIVNEQSLLELKADSLRMLGRVADYKKDFAQSKRYYEQILEIYRTNNSPRTMEIKSFLAASLVNLGNIDEGLALARTTFEEFENSELKQKDYFTWAVWKSGLWSRIIKSLIEKKVTFDREEMKKYLDVSEEILKNPQGQITWGDKNFQFRIDEINQTRALLNQIQ